MLWLFLARGRAGQDGAAELAANAEKLEAKDWPSAVIAFYLGQRPAEAILAAAATPDEGCDAQFYLGEWHLLRGNQAEAKAALKIAVERCPSQRFLVVPAAAAELNRLNR